MQATTPTPDCPQLFGIVGSGGPQSEDCLRVDIYAPPNAQDLPVKVFIYGGGNVGGSISLPIYGACGAATDAVIVTVNYRTGPWGWLNIDSFGINGNMGTQDQLLALQWVKDNIAAFGGDSSNVLLHGQSAGAQNTMILASLPQIRSLAKAAISESSPGQILQNSTAANAIGELYAQHLKCSNLTCLQQLPLATTNATAVGSVSGLRLTLQQLLTPGGGGIFFGPIVDGELVPEQPTEVGSQIPIVFGSTSQEATFLLTMFFGSSPTAITPTVYRLFLDAVYGDNATAIEAAYPVSRWNNTQFPAFYAMSQVLTDGQFTCVAYRALKKAVQRGTPTWAYRWEHQPTCPFSTQFAASELQLDGAVHTSELPFVFGNTEHSPPPNGNCSFNAAEKTLSKDIISYWTSMAVNAAPSADWPQFSLDTSQGIVITNETAQIVPGSIDYTMCETLFTL